MKPLQHRDTGDETQMRIDALYPCPSCKGSGHVIEYPRQEYRPEHDQIFTDGPIDLAVCRTCNGSGTVAYDPDDTSIPY